MGWDESVGIDSAADFKQFKGKTIRSVEGITTDKLFYFWATFDDNGINYGAGDEGSKPRGGYSYQAKLNNDALENNGSKANFSDNKGSIQFLANAGEKVSKITVTFDKDSGYAKEYIDASPFECQFVNE